MKKIFLYGFSARGPAHIRHNLPNQDSFLVKKFGSFSLLVVSDGMGSKKYADIGSKAVCRAVYKVLRKYVYIKKKYRKAKGSVFAMIKKEWLRLIFPYNEKDCSATCLFVLCSSKKCLATMLGDGLIYIQGTDASSSQIMTDEKSEDFSNATVSMSSSNYLNEWKCKFISLKKIKSILLISDGISSDLQDGKERDFSNDLLDDLRKEKTIRQKKSILNQIVSNWPVPMHSDDKTIAVMEISR